MFMPNSPSPPRGIAKREGLLNAVRILVRDTSSYHTGLSEVEGYGNAKRVVSKFGKTISEVEA
jgi:hypothetical protein